MNFQNMIILDGRKMELTNFTLASIYQCLVDIAEIDLEDRTTTVLLLCKNLDFNDFVDYFRFRNDYGSIYNEYIDESYIQFSKDKCNIIVADKKVWESKCFSLDNVYMRIIL